MKNRRGMMGSIGLMVALSAGTTPASDYYWRFVTNGALDNPANWGQGGRTGTDGVPGVNDTAYIESRTVGESASLTLAGCLTNANVNIKSRGPSVTFNLDESAIYAAKTKLAFYALNENAVTTYLCSGCLSSPVVEIGGLKSGEKNNMTVVVNGPQARLATSAYDISMGYNGSTNENLIVSNGAQVVSARGIGVGMSFSPGGTGSNCTMTVSGSGTLVRCATGGIGVGYNGPMNSLCLENGATMIPGNGNNGLLELGVETNGDFNEVIIRGGGVMTNLAATGSSLVGDKGMGNCLTVTGAGSCLTLGNLYLGGNPYQKARLGIGENKFILNDGATAQFSSIVCAGMGCSLGNQIEISGSGTTLSAGYLISGGMGGESMVTVKDGAQVGLGFGLNVGYNKNTLVADEPFCGTGNVCRVWGPGTTVSCRGCSVGADTATTANQLILENGASVLATNIAGSNYLPYYDGDCTLGGLNSDTRANSGSSDNRMDILSASALIATNAFIIGYQTNSCRNVCHVEGKGSRISARYGCRIGFHGASNRLEVVDEATACAGGLYLGASGSSNLGNALIIDNGMVTQNTAGFWKDNNGFAMTNSSLLSIAGTNSVLTILGTSLIGNDSTVRFILDATPYLQIPVTSPTHDMTVDASAKLEIDAEKLSNAGGAKNLTLMSFSVASPTLTNLVNNVTFLSGEGRVTVSADYKRLMLDVASSAGSRVILR